MSLTPNHDDVTNDTTKSPLSIDYMLGKLPGIIEIDQSIIECFDRLGPLTYQRFREVADENGLKPPSDDEDEVTIKMRKDTEGNIEISQFDVKTNQRSGICRFVRADGKVVTEQVMFGTVATGLSRKIKAPTFFDEGSVTFTIYDRDQMLDLKQLTLDGRLLT